MFRKSSLLLFMVLVFLLVSAPACEKKDKKGVQEFGFVGGTEGLAISFVEGNPPTKVFSKDPFLISVQLENKGEYDVTEGQVLSTLEGISYKSYSIEQPTLTNEIPIERVRFDRQLNKKMSGGIEQINYEAEFVDEIDFETTHTMSVNVCYLYQTRAVSSLCLVNNPTQRPRETDVCVVTETKGVGNSGSPVQISALAERASGKSEVSFNFQIENKGQGKVYKPEFIEKPSPKCSDAGNEDLLDWVQVTIAPPEGLTLKCPKLGNSNSGAVRLIKGSSTVVCTLDTLGVAQNAPFPGEVKIQLDYIYKEHTSKPVTVERAA